MHWQLGAPFLCFLIASAGELLHCCLAEGPQWCVQGAEKVKAAQQEAEAMKRETALAAAALEGRTQALARQEAAAAEAKALLAVRVKELDSREVHFCAQH